MPDTSRLVQRVADRHVSRLVTALQVALRQGARRVNEGQLARAIETGHSERAAQLAAGAVQDGDLRVLEPKLGMDARLLDVAEDSANATRCAVRPTRLPRNTMGRAARDVAAQLAGEASEATARRMVGSDTVQRTADISRAINSTPMRRPTDALPAPVAVRDAIREAGRVATFDATEATVKRLSIADLKPNGELVADSELVVRYRSNLPVSPVVVNEEGVILDGRRRVASAWAAGHDKIYAVVVKSDDGAMAMEWLRWNN